MCVCVCVYVKEYRGVFLVLTCNPISMSRPNDYHLSLTLERLSKSSPTVLIKGSSSYKEVAPGVRHEWWRALKYVNEPGPRKVYKRKGYLLIFPY